MFWETAMGLRLAETLMYCLPKLVDKKQQKIVVYTPSSEQTVEDVLNEHIKKGWLFVNSIVEDGKYVIIFEKGENA